MKLKEAVLASVLETCGSQVADLLKDASIWATKDTVVIEVTAYTSAEGTVVTVGSAATYLRDILLTEDQHGQTWRDDVLPALAKKLGRGGGDLAIQLAIRP